MRRLTPLIALLFVLLACAPAQARTVSLQPAAGAAGSVVALRGEGLPARRSVVISFRGGPTRRVRTDASGAFATTVRIPARARGALKIASRVGSLRLVNRFRVGGAPAGEVAGPRALRVRWTPLQATVGTPVHVSGTGVRGRKVTIALGDAKLVRRPRRGRFAGSVAAGGRDGWVRAGGLRLRFAVTLLDAAGNAIEDPADSPVPGRPVSGRPAAGATPATSAAAPAGPAELTFPIRAAFYYPWFPEGWDQGGMKPFTKYHPTLGWYSADDRATIERHLQQFDYAHIQVAISSWWGIGHYTDRRLPQLLAATRAVGSNVRWAAYYEKEGFGDPPVATLATELKSLRDRVFSDPAYLRIGGRPVVFVYGDPNDGCATADRWRQANQGINAYVVLKVFPGYGGCAAQPSGWHQYAPAVRTASVSGQSYSVSPGFWLATDSAARLGRDIGCFRRGVRDMVASKAPWQLVTTFNEWGEGTSVEPASEWGNAYLDALHDNGAGTVPATAC